MFHACVQRVAYASLHTLQPDKFPVLRRRDWRELLYTAPGLGQYISGAIMFEETLYQTCESGQPFVDVLQKAGTACRYCMLLSTSMYVYIRYKPCQSHCRSPLRLSG